MVFLASQHLLLEKWSCGEFSKRRAFENVHGSHRTPTYLHFPSREIYDASRDQAPYVASSNRGLWFLEVVSSQFLCGTQWKVDFPSMRCRTLFALSHFFLCFFGFLRAGRSPISSVHFALASSFFFIRLFPFVSLRVLLGQTKSAEVKREVVNGCFGGRFIVQKCVLVHVCGSSRH